MGWLLKRQCPPFSVLNRCALIGRIYLSLVAYSGQVALPPTDCLGLSLFWAFCPKASGQDSPLTATKGRDTQTYCIYRRNGHAGPFRLIEREKRGLVN